MSIFRYFDSKMTPKMDYESKTGLLKQVRNVGDAMHELLIIELLRYMHWKCFWETSIGDEDIELHLVVIYAVRTKEWMKKFRGDDDVKLSNFWKCSFKKPRRSELVLEASTHDSPISPSSKGGNSSTNKERNSTGILFSSLWKTEFHKNYGKFSMISWKNKFYIIFWKRWNF